MDLYTASSCTHFLPNPRRIAWASNRRCSAFGFDLKPCQMPFKSNSERCSGAMRMDGHCCATRSRNERRAGRQYFHSIVRGPSPLPTNTRLLGSMEHKFGLVPHCKGRMRSETSSTMFWAGSITSHSRILGFGPYKNTSIVLADIEAISDAWSTMISGSSTSPRFLPRLANSRT